MDNYDTMAMPYLASPLAINTLESPAGDYLGAMPPSLPYEHEPFVGGDELPYQQAMVAHPMRRFSDSQFEDTYSDMMPPPVEPQPTAPEQQDASSIDHNHKLLHFYAPIYHFTLLDFTLRRTSLSMTAQLHGMFFLAESPWTASPTSEMPPPNAELTCYRRNLFQITGSITLPRGLRYIMTDNGDRIPVLAQDLTVSATESVEGNPVKIISVPWKTPAANAATGQPEDKTEKEPPSIPLEMLPGQEMDSDYATFPIAWKRLQFRIATANNGRRKELQQHFVIRLKVMATLSTGAKIPICEAHSGPVIVRGRSPRNFQSRKDLPLSGSAAASRKHAQAAASNRAATQDSAKSQQAAGSKRSKSPQEPTPAPLSLHFDSDSKTPQQDTPQQQQRTPPSTLQEWPGVTATASASFPTYTSTSITGIIPAYTQAGSELSGPPGKRRRTNNNTLTTNDNNNHGIIPAGTISLSLLDDDPSVTERPSSSSTATANPVTSPRVRLANGHTSHQQQQQQRQKPTDGIAEVPRKSPTSPPSNQQPRSMSNYNISLVTQFNHHLSPQLAPPHFVNPNETADLLYEYFPLALDEWQEPIDGVYRPHVVHHTNMPDDPKAIAARNRSKRYFAGEAS